MRQLLLTGLAVGPLFLGVMAHNATGGNAIVGWTVFLMAVTLAGLILKTTNLDR